MEKFVNNAIRWIGSINSLLIHTLLFIVFFALLFFADAQKILLVLTTIVSLEAIFLSIFIQMSVNIQSNKLNSVASDVEEIQKDVEEIQEDVEEIQEDVEEIQEEDEEDAQYLKIEKTMNRLLKEVSELKQKGKK
jgi:peptidoglycan hydrolase CwlO-like protein